MTVVRAAEPFAELALHALAHVPLGGPESLYDAAYVRTFGESLLASDGPHVGALLEANPPSSMAVQHLPLLHRSFEEHRRAMGRTLDALTDADVTDTSALRALRTVPQAAIEVLRADLTLAHSAFEVFRAAQRSRVESLARELETLLHGVPALAPPELELALALGARGRAFGRRIVVGAPLHHDVALAAVLACHEHACAQRSTGRYATTELRALTHVARQLTRGPGPLRDAHAAWLAAIALDSVLTDAQVAGALPRDVLDALLREPARRAEVLASLPDDESR